MFKEMIRVGVNYCDIANPTIVYASDVEGFNTEDALKRLTDATGKKLILVNDEHKYTQNDIMYSTRNRLRSEVRKQYPDDQKVFWYFPIDDSIRAQEAVAELIKLSKVTENSACMFRFHVSQCNNNFSAATHPICSPNDIRHGDWGGYCAYTILNEDECPLYPEIAIPNVAFYVALYEAGYKEYSSDKICVEHLRHSDSHHFRVKDTTMSKTVASYLAEKKKELLNKEGESE